MHGDQDLLGHGFGLDQGEEAKGRQTSRTKIQDYPLIIALLCALIALLLTAITTGEYTITQQLRVEGYYSNAKAFIVVHEDSDGTALGITTWPPTEGRRQTFLLRRMEILELDSTGVRRTVLDHYEGSVGPTFVLDGVLYQRKLSEEGPRLAVFRQGKWLDTSEEERKQMPARPREVWERMEAQGWKPLEWSHDWRKQGPTIDVATFDVGGKSVRIEDRMARHGETATRELTLSNLPSQPDRMVVVKMWEGFLKTSRGGLHRYNPSQDLATPPH